MDRLCHQQNVLVERSCSKRGGALVVSHRGLQIGADTNHAQEQIYHPVTRTLPSLRSPICHRITTTTTTIIIIIIKIIYL